LLNVMQAWLLINIGDGAWIYFYIYSAVHPNPRTAVNITHRGWTAYTVLMFMFGFCWGVINLIVFWAYFASEAGFASSYTRKISSMRLFFNLIIMLPIATVLCLGPFFSPFAGLSLAQKAAWKHGCDNFPVQIILSTKAYNGPSTEPNTAQYFLGKEPIYTYDIFQQSADDWTFNIRTLDSPALANNQSDPIYPSVSNITYNFVDNTVSANCTSPNANTTFRCVDGSFNPNDYLSFKISDLRDNSTTNLNAVDKQWAFGNDAPSVILKDESGVEVIRTDVTNPSACTQLKVCAGRSSGADILVPIGLILTRQADYAVECTTPSND